MKLCFTGTLKELRAQLAALQPVAVVTEPELRNDLGEVIREEVTVAQLLRDPNKINIFLHDSPGLLREEAGDVGEVLDLGDGEEAEEEEEKSESKEVGRE
jgi:hypothetical protein